MFRFLFIVCSHKLYAKFFFAPLFLLNQTIKNYFAGKQQRKSLVVLFSLLYLPRPLSLICFFPLPGQLSFYMDKTLCNFDDGSPFQIFTSTSTKSVKFISLLINRYIYSSLSLFFQDKWVLSYLVQLPFSLVLFKSIMPNPLP